jgi:hypothetical protein
MHKLNLESRSWQVKLIQLNRAEAMQRLLVAERFQRSDLGGAACRHPHRQRGD